MDEINYTILNDPNVSLEDVRSLLDRTVPLKNAPKEVVKLYSDILLGIFQCNVGLGMSNTEAFAHTLKQALDPIETSKIIHELVNESIEDHS